MLKKKMFRKSIFYGMTEFYDGLVFFAMSRKTRDAKWIFGASKALSKMEEYNQIASANCDHKLLLLQAEARSLSSENEEAAKCYELAIATAEKNDFPNEQAIANERAGDFFLRTGDTKKASHHYGIAHALYLEWGAQEKADHLCKHIPF